MPRQSEQRANGVVIEHGDDMPMTVHKVRRVFSACSQQLGIALLGDPVEVACCQPRARNTDPIRDTRQDEFMGTEARTRSALVLVEHDGE